MPHAMNGGTTRPTLFTDVHDEECDMDELQPKADGARRTVFRINSGLIFVVSLCLYWLLAGILLWWSYDITPLIRGGYYQVNRALLLVGEMGLIITALTAVVWVLARRHTTVSSTWQLVWNVSWTTWIFLLVYAAAVLARVELGRGNVPLDDSAFLPVLGHVNSHFFSESNWLIFLLYVVPVMGCVSGALYCLQDRVLKAAKDVSL
jgi:hypothetical protein